MKIFSEAGVEMDGYDEAAGYITTEQRLVQHHEAVTAVVEQFHYVVAKRYPNGGADVEKVIDVPGVEASEAWDEYEEVGIFHPYPQSTFSEDELDEEEEYDKVPSQLDRIEAQVMYTALMTDTLMEE